MLKELRNATVEINGNIYFDGKVTSRKLLLDDGSMITLGIVLPGEYEFSVVDREDVQLTNGFAEVLLPNEKEWKTVNQGQIFTVIAKSKYRIKCKVIVEYLCSYKGDKSL